MIEIITKHIRIIEINSEKRGRLIFMELHMWLSDKNGPNPSLCIGNRG